MSGMPSQVAIFVSRSPVFTTLEGFEGESLAKYQPKGSPLLSGYLLGEKYINGYSASLDVQHGDGHVILIGFSPQWRGQPMGTYRILFNALFYAGQLADQHIPSTDFWKPPVIKEDKEEENEKTVDKPGKEGN